MRGMDTASADLIYLDPPFNSKKDYAAPIGSQAAGAAFQDTWSLDDVKREWVEDIETDNTATWSAITTAGFTNGESTQAYLTYMAVRLIEMRRILKPTGSIYLHCDPTMSHYLKIVMDAIFGRGNFANEVIWFYGAGGRSRRHFGRKHDILLYYRKSKDYVFNGDAVRIEMKAGRTSFGGRLRVDDSGRKYREVWGTGRKKLYRYYLDEGKIPEDVWEMPSIQSQDQERLGYPTQKPLALLERIIKASSNPGDMVLDPFCGCATTCIAAEKLGRQWAGIDIESKAREIVVSRLKQQADDGVLFKGGILPEIHHLKRPPKRTDTDAPQRSKNIKRVLFERQAGRCAGKCGPQAEGRVLDLDLFEVDHIVPRSKGGADIDDNLQLLCPTCNRRKGSKTMAYLLGLTD